MAEIRISAAEASSSRVFQLWFQVPCFTRRRKVRTRSTPHRRRRRPLASCPSKQVRLHSNSTTFSQHFQKKSKSQRGKCKGESKKKMEGISSHAPSRDSGSAPTWSLPEAPHVAGVCPAKTRNSLGGSWHFENRKNELCWENRGLFCESEKNPTDSISKAVFGVGNCGWLPVVVTWPWSRRQGHVFHLLHFPFHSTWPQIFHFVFFRRGENTDKRNEKIKQH